MMICETCKEDRHHKDFIGCQKSCFKCIYKEKKSKLKKQNSTENLCRICQKIIKNHPTKIVKRTVYCSLECAYIGHLKQNKSFWTKKIKKNCYFI